MAREQEKFEDNEIYPIEASELGINAYYIPGCEVVGHQPSYAACLKKVAERKNGRLPTHHADCLAAIGHKTCQAMRMRKEEVVEGRAIYFINRKKMQAFHQYRSEMDQQRWAAMTFGKDDKKPKRPAPAPAPVPTAEPPKPKHFLDMNTGSYADAINAALKPAAPEPAAPASKPVEQPKPTLAAPVKAGMSLLEMARLQMAAKATV